MKKNTAQHFGMQFTKTTFVTGLFMAMSYLLSCNAATDEQTVLREQQPLPQYKEQGDSITLAAQSVLLSQVSREMKNGGPTNAIDFCNIHASNIMDSLSTIYGVTIRRITEKPRNPLNKASDLEKEIFRSLTTHNANDTFVMETKTYYKNIYVGMETCLKCHGKQEQISPETRTIIADRYPNDQAKDYQLGDLRGAWKIVFENK